MDRLTDRDPCENAICKREYTGDGCDENCYDCEYNYECLKKLTYYEDLEEQGRLLILPCKIGDPVWLVESTECNRYGCPYQGDYGNWRCKVNGKEQCKPFVYEKPFDYGMIGRKFYLTREYAEVALSKKLKKNI